MKVIPASQCPQDTEFMSQPIGMSDETWCRIAKAYDMEVVINDDDYETIMTSLKAKKGT